MPNDPKLSHTPERRGLCGRRRSRVGRRAVGVVKGSVVGWWEAVRAQAVTRRRVGCSAWLGVAGMRSRCAIIFLLIAIVRGDGEALRGERSDGVNHCVHVDRSSNAVIGWKSEEEFVALDAPATSGNTFWCIFVPLYTPSPVCVECDNPVAVSPSTDDAIRVGV